MSSNSYIGIDPFTRTVADSISDGSLKAVVVFSASGSYTVPTGVTKLLIHVVGGGGGGGGAGAAYAAGAGGGGGGYGSSFLSVTEGTVYAITVGTGGAGGTTAVGTTGNSSSFGSSIIALGGVGGASNVSNGLGGVGGTCSGGNLLNITGGSGFPAYSTTRPGQGGNSAFLNGAGSIRATAGVGSAGTSSTGAGGSGGLTSPNAGGAGGNGVVIIYEYGITVN